MRYSAYLIGKTNAPGWWVERTDDIKRWVETVSKDNKRLGNPHELDRIEEAEHYWIVTFRAKEKGDKHG